MTRKHFEAIASVFATLGDAYDAFADDAASGFDDGFAAGQLQALSEIAEDVADVLAEANPRFDRDKFLDACGV